MCHEERRAEETALLVPLSAQFVNPEGSREEFERVGPILLQFPKDVVHGVEICTAIEVRCRSLLISSPQEPGYRLRIRHAQPGAASEDCFDLKDSPLSR